MAANTVKNTKLPMAFWRGLTLTPFVSCRNVRQHYSRRPTLRHRDRRTHRLVRLAWPEQERRPTLGCVRSAGALSLEERDCSSSATGVRTCCPVRIRVAAPSIHLKPIKPTTLLFLIGTLGGELSDGHEHADDRSGPKQIRWIDFARDYCLLGTEPPARTTLAFVFDISHTARVPDSVSTTVTRCSRPESAPSIPVVRRAWFVVFALRAVLVGLDTPGHSYIACILTRLLIEGRTSVEK